MADGSSIEWTDATVNAVNGCTRVSPGCGGPGPHGGCYAERLAGTRLRNHPSRLGLARQTPAGPRWTGKVLLHEPALLAPLSWRRPRKIFWNAHGDLFHENVPVEWIDRCFAVMALTPQHIHQVLTKRPERMRAYIEGHSWERVVTSCRDQRGASMITRHTIQSLEGLFRLRPPFSYEPDRSAWPLPNVWLGTSVETRPYMLERAAELKATPSAVRFWSAEPLLGDLGEIPPELMPDWVICGGESGPKARPMHPDWARSLRDQCAAAGVPFFFKQWGEWLPADQDGASRPMGNAFSGWVGAAHQDWFYGDRGTVDVDDQLRFEPKDALYWVGKAKAGRLLDGVEHNGVPA